ncbi:MAG: hypothetical protein OXT09_24030 [Myxococcales bacterium]|nr:hypothetical protein [Myxococcales bacterium]
MFSQSQLRVSCALWVAAALLACSDDADDGGGAGNGSQPPACLEPLDLDCAPTFAPTFEGFFDNQLSTTCGSTGTGVSCHGPDGAQGELVLDDADTAYDQLLGPGTDGEPRVIPNDPECSPLIQRLESDDPTFVMPVGGKLSDGERCAVRQWVANGAQR